MLYVPQHRFYVGFLKPTLLLLTFPATITLLDVV